MIGAFFKALLEVIAELIRGEIKQDITATNADPVPKSLRARFLTKYKRMRDDSGGVR